MLEVLQELSIVVCLPFGIAYILIPKRDCTEEGGYESDSTLGKNNQPKGWIKKVLQWSGAMDLWSWE
eukprot:6488112-Amphidinium_carterae.1